MFSSSSYDRFGSRGLGRGRGRGGYSAAYRGPRSASLKTSRCPSPPVGPVLATIRYSELEAGQASSSNAKIKGVEDVASYNWLKAKGPTIVTPGYYFLSPNFSQNFEKILT